MSDPLRVLVTGAAGQIAYSLLFSIAKGDVFGADRKITLVLLDIEAMMGVLQGVVMELQDCALSNLSSVEPTSDVNKAFEAIDYACLVGAMPRREGMERKDLLKANVKIFKQQGQALDKFAKKTVRVLVVGNPANTNCFICRKYAPSIPAENFTCMTRLDQNRAMAQIAHRVGVSSQDVKNVVIWGNHSSTQFPDVRHATVAGKTVQEAIKDDDWLKNEFVNIVQTRGADVIKARKLSSAMSAANAICDHLRSWECGTPQGELTSMGVVSDGSYGIEVGLVYSFPVEISGGKIAIKQGLEIDDFAREKLDITLAELVEERDAALETTQD